MDDLMKLPPMPLTTEELRARGLSKKALARLQRVGKLRRVLRGVYVRTEVPDSLQLRTTALALVVSPHHVVVDRTAAWLHRIDVLAHAEHETLPPVETCALRGRNPTKRHDVDGRSRDLADEDLMTIGGMPVTTPLRTALDLGCHLHRREALAALNAFARDHGITPAELTEQLPRYKRRRGVVQLRELIPLIDPRIESQRESWVWGAISDAGLPLPIPQFWIEIDGVRAYRLDFAYPLSRVCVEYDGAEAHDSTDAQREYDAVRRAWLRANGWTVIVVKVGDFTGERLDRWVRALREALRPTYTTRRW